MHVPHDRRDEGGEQPRRVLVVGMDHDHDVGAFVQRQRVARLLVGAVAAILGVDVDGGPRERSRLPDRVVAARIVHDDHAVDESVGQDLFVRALERE